MVRLKELEKVFTEDKDGAFVKTFFQGASYIRTRWSVKNAKKSGMFCIRTWESATSLPHLLGCGPYFCGFPKYTHHSFLTFSALPLADDQLKRHNVAQIYYFTVKDLFLARLFELETYRNGASESERCFEFRS